MFRPFNTHKNANLVSKKLNPEIYSQGVALHATIPNPFLVPTLLAHLSPSTTDGVHPHKLCVLPSLDKPIKMIYEVRDAHRSKFDTRYKT
jgi:hypothetical protein